MTTDIKGWDGNWRSMVMDQTRVCVRARVLYAILLLSRCYTANRNFALLLFCIYAVVAEVSICFVIVNFSIFVRHHSIWYGFRLFISFYAYVSTKCAYNLHFVCARVYIYLCCLSLYIYLEFFGIAEMPAKMPFSCE